jgi:excisionase family DNA binding protein
VGKPVVDLGRLALPGTAPLLKPDEAAEALQVSRATVYRMVDRHELAGVRIGLGPRPRLRISTAELQRFITTTKERDGHGSAD